MILKDVKDIIPLPLRESGPGWDAYATIIEDNYDFFFNKIVTLIDFYVPWKTPFPQELARMMGAYLTTDDTAREVREKAAGAAAFHKAHVIFVETWKPFLDALTSQDTRIWKGQFLSAGFIIGSASDGIVGQSALGRSPIAWTPGNVFLDLRTTPTAAWFTKIRSNFTDVHPTYFTVYVGHTYIHGTYGEIFEIYGELTPYNP